MKYYIEFTTVVISIESLIHNCYHIIHNACFGDSTSCYFSFSACPFVCKSDKRFIISCDTINVLTGRPLLQSTSYVLHMIYKLRDLRLMILSLLNAETFLLFLSTELFYIKKQLEIFFFVVRTISLEIN